MNKDKAIYWVILGLFFSPILSFLIFLIPCPSITLIGMPSVFGFFGTLFGIIGFIQVRRKNEPGLLLAILAILSGIFFMSFVYHPFFLELITAIMPSCGV